MAILLKRDAKVFCSLVESGWTASDTTRLNILDDFSFTQTVSTDAAVRSPIGPSGDRGVLSYISITNPAEFSFTTYLSTFSGALTNKVLWKAFTNKNDISIIDFTESNVGQLPLIHIWFEYKDKTYKLKDGVITAAKITMQIGGIPKILWTGQSKSLLESTPPNIFTNETLLIPETVGKLTTITAVRNSVSYDLALTNFNLDIDNGIEWISRTRLGKQSLPDAYQTGTRSITGECTFYLKTGALQSSTLLKDLLDDNLIGAPEKFTALNVFLGGTINLAMPNVLLENGAVSTEDVLTLKVPFTANQTSPNTGDELTITI